MRYLPLISILLCLGCHREDGEKLARIGRIATDKLRDVTPNKNPLNMIRLDTSLAGRVRGRFETDVFLVDQPIQVEESGDTIHLKGNVATREHRDRAIQLARETVGVARVTSDLTVPE